METDRRGTRQGLDRPGRRTHLAVVMRPLLALLVLAAAVPRAQTVVTLDGPATIRLGEPLVLQLRATLASPGGWPSILLPGMTDGEAVTVRRDAADGPIVDLDPTLVVCGIGAPHVMTGTEWPAGTVTHHELVVHDARLMTPGRYVVQVAYHDFGTGSPYLADTVALAVEVLVPDDAAGQAASQAVAAAVRAATDVRYTSWPRWTAFREAVAVAGADPIGDVAAAGAAIHAPDRWRPPGETPDSLDIALQEAIAALADRYLTRRPAGPLAPEAARARDPEHARVLDLRGVCESRVFAVVGASSQPLQAVAVGLAETIDVPPQSGEAAYVLVEFSRPVQAVHLRRGGVTLAVARPNDSTCRDEESGPPWLRLTPR